MMLKQFVSSLICLGLLVPAATATDAPASWDQLFKQGVELCQKKDYKGAEQSLKQALEQSSGTSNEARSTIALADLYRLTKKGDEAEPLYRKAIALHERLATPYDVAMDKNSLAGLYKDQGKFEKSEELYREALMGLEKSKGKNDLSVATVTSNLALLYQKQGKAEEAIKQSERAVKIYNSQSPDSPELAQSLLDLGAAEMHEMQLKKAAEHYERAYKIYSSKLPADDLRLAVAADSYGTACYALGLNSRAEDLAKQALTIYKKRFPPDNMEIAIMLSNLGHRILKQKRADEALGYFEQSLAIQQKKLGKDNLESLANLSGMAEAYAFKEQLPKCELVLRKVLALKEAKSPNDSIAIVPSLVNLGNCLQASGRKGDAMPYFQRVDGILANLPAEKRRQLDSSMHHEIIELLAPKAKKEEHF